MRAGLSRWRRRGRDRPQELKPISGWLLLPAVVLVTAATWLVYVLTTRVAGPDAGASARIDIVKTALTTAAGTGGAIALLLAFRRQHTSEITGAHTIRDATERRVTELYGRAVDQLGSDKAAVRLGGLYALERLAQDNPSQRQTISNVLCAYLRMPHTPPPHPGHGRGQARRTRRIAGAAAAQRPDGNEQRRQEHEVRLTAQRILQDHLRCPDPQSPPLTYWPNIDLDLTGAHLTNLDLSQCRVRSARFAYAHVTGPTLFEGATFTGDALFDDATFTGHTWFGKAIFSNAASFWGATFTGPSLFDRATFTGDAWFAGATFTGDALFGGATFTGDAWFAGATFTGKAVFQGAAFTGEARFGGATFTGKAVFQGAAFTGDAWFGGATFAGEASFDGAAVAEGAVKPSVWPAGWTVAKRSSPKGHREVVRTAEP